MRARFVDIQTRPTSTTVPSAGHPPGGRAADGRDASGSCVASGRPSLPVPAPERRHHCPRRAAAPAMRAALPRRGGGARRGHVGPSPPQLDRRRGSATATGMAQCPRCLVWRQRAHVIAVSGGRRVASAPELAAVVTVRSAGAPFRDRADGWMVPRSPARLARTSRAPGSVPLRALLQ